MWERLFKRRHHVFLKVVTFNDDFLKVVTYDDFLNVVHLWTSLKVVPTNFLIVVNYVHKYHSAYLSQSLKSTMLVTEMISREVTDKYWDRLTHRCRRLHRPSPPPPAFATTSKRPLRSHPSPPPIGAARRRRGGWGWHCRCGQAPCLGASLGLPGGGGGDGASTSSPRLSSRVGDNVGERGGRGDVDAKALNHPSVARLKHWVLR